MADLRWAQGSIAGVDLENESGDKCKALIVDGAALQPRRFVNQRSAADGTVYTQGFSTEGRGARFGVRFEFIPPALLQEIIAAVNTAVDALSTFDVALDDDFHNVDAACTVDGSNWLKYDAQRTNSVTMKGVELRFITVEVNESGS